MATRSLRRRFPERHWQTMSHGCDRFFGARRGPVVVAGHCYGGQIVTALGNDASQVTALVNVAAFGLDEGESLGTVLANAAPTAALAHLIVDEHDVAWMPEADFVRYFATDIDPARATIMHAVQQGLSMRTPDDVMGAPAWRSHPTWYLVATNDDAIPPDLEQMFARRMGADTLEVASSHVVIVSHPHEVVELIKAAAASRRSA